MSEDYGDGTRSIEGVETNVKGKQPQQRPSMPLHAGSTRELMQEGHYADGQVRHGINPRNVHHTASKDHYASETQHAQRRGLGSTPYPGKR